MTQTEPFLWAGSHSKFRVFEVILLRESYIKKLFTLEYRLDYSTFSVSKKCNTEDQVSWPGTIMDNTIWFVAADPVADRLDPGDSFFVNIRFTCFITSIDFDAQWSMGPLIGGEILPINTTALLLAGVQTNLAWIIPIALSVIGLGVILVRKKF